MATRRFRVKFEDGPFPRTRAHTALLRRPAGRRWRPSLLRRKTALPSRPSPWGHRPSRRTHHVLLSDRHLLRPQRRILFTPLALLPVPPLITDSPSEPRFTRPRFSVACRYRPIADCVSAGAANPSFLYLELRANKRLYPFFLRQSQTGQFPFALQINVKVKKWAALAFRCHPLRQVRQRYV